MIQQVKRFLSEQSSRINTDIGFIEIEECLPVDGSDLSILIKGELHGNVVSDPGSYHQDIGVWEWYPFDYVDGWDFYGEINVVDEDLTFVKKIEL